MDEIDRRARQQNLAGIPERALDRRVDALEIAVEPDDAQQVDRHLEDPGRLTLGVHLAVLQLAEGGHRVVHAGGQLRPHALEPAQVDSVVEPVLSDRAVFRVDLVHEPVRRGVNVAERGRDVSDLIPAGVVHPSGDITASQTARGRRHLAQRARDRAPQRQRQRRHQHEDGQRQGHVAHSRSTRAIELVRHDGNQIAAGRCGNSS